MKIGVCSFFSGSGFLDTGFEQAKIGSEKPFQVLMANELSSSFASVYRFNHSRNTNEKGQAILKTCSIDDFLTSHEARTLLHTVLQGVRGKYDFVGFIGGPPCPDFSVAGKNKGRSGTHGRLSQSYVTLIIQSKPDFFVLENVKGLIRTAKHKEFFEELIAQVKQAGYATTWNLLNGLNFGVPQDRERVFLVGVRRELLPNVFVNDKQELQSFDWEIGMHFTEDAKQIKRMPCWPKHTPFVPEEQNTQVAPDHKYRELTVQYWFDKNDVTNHPNANAHFQVRSARPKFERYDEGDDSHKSSKRLHRWRFSPAAAYGNNEVHLHPYKIRRLSVAEALAIQSAPKDFAMPPGMTLSQMFKTIGNGVPIKLAEGVAVAVGSFLKRVSEK